MRDDMIYTKEEKKTQKTYIYSPSKEIPSVYHPLSMSKFSIARLCYFMLFLFTYFLALHVYIILSRTTVLLYCPLILC